MYYIVRRRVFSFYLTPWGPSSILSFRYTMTVVQIPARGPTFLANGTFLESMKAAQNPAVDPERNALTSLNFARTGAREHCTPDGNHEITRFDFEYLSHNSSCDYLPVNIDRKDPNISAFWSAERAVCCNVNSWASLFLGIPNGAATTPHIPPVTNPRTTPSTS